MYLYLKSTDSANLHEDNKWSDFTVSLPRILYLHREAKWECALLSINIAPLPRVRSVRKTLMGGLYAYCDFIESSVVLGSMQPLLSLVNLDETGNIAEKYIPPQYMNVSRECVPSVRIYLRKEDGSIPLLESTVTSCILHLRRG